MRYARGGEQTQTGPINEPTSDANHRSTLHDFDASAQAVAKIGQKMVS